MNILVIGNGFDLAHRLPTGYPDFLGFCRMVKAVYSMDKNDNADKIWESLGIKLKDDINTERLKLKFSELYSVSVTEKNEERGSFIRTNTFFDELYDDIEENIWIDYFLQNPMYQKENWIDFESEISSVIQSIESEFKEKDLDLDMGSINLEFFDRQVLEKKTDITSTGRCVAKIKKVTYREMRDKLCRDLNRLIRALEIYLSGYVGEIECKLISPDIEEIVIKWGKDKYGMEKNNISKVLSFNYSDTYERIYLSKQTGLIDEYINYIHGKADRNHTIETNDMVLGIDEYLPNDRKNKDLLFIAFKKYYQRIYKETGCKYKEWLDDIIMINNKYKDELIDCEKEWQITKGMEDYGYKSRMRLEEMEKNQPRHNLYIFGHSLDITDGDILRELILNENVYTTVFYLNKAVMGQQIANLVKVIGQDELIQRTSGRTKTIEFKLQENMVERG